MERLALMRVRYRDDLEVTAAFASFGLGTDGDNVLDWLTEFGLRHSVDARTVRRWSDAGLVKLVPVILSVAPWIDPRIGVRVSVAGAAVGGCAVMRRWMIC